MYKEFLYGSILFACILYGSNMISNFVLCQINSNENERENERKNERENERESEASRISENLVDSILKEINEENNICNELNDFNIILLQIKSKLNKIKNLLDSV